MFGAIQFILCLTGVVSCLAGIVLLAFVFKEVWPCNILEVLLLVSFVIMLCLCATLFVYLSAIEVTV